MVLYQKIIDAIIVHIQQEDKPVYVYNIGVTLIPNGDYDAIRGADQCRGAAGDSIILTLDLIDKKISIIDKPKDGIEKAQTLFEDIETGHDIRYKIAISMIQPGTQITLNGISYGS